MSCVRLDVTGQGEVRPYRKKSADHIDGAVAAVMGFRLAHEATAAAPPRESVYKRRGLLVL